MRLYPEKTDAVSETWQASKWVSGLHPSLLSPMVIGRHSQHFYTMELAFTDTNGFVIPTMWFSQKGKLYGDCWLVAEQVPQVLVFLCLHY